MLVDFLSKNKNWQNNQQQFESSNVKEENINCEHMYNNLKVVFIVFAILIVCLIVFALSREIYKLKTDQNTLKRVIVKIYKKLHSSQTHIIETETAPSTITEIVRLQEAQGNGQQVEQVIPQTKNVESVVIQHIHVVPKFPEIV